MPTLEITTLIGCPLKCAFCPQDKLRESYGDGERRLSFENFKTILAKIPDYVRIDFSGMSEPFAIGASAVEMIRHTLERGYSIALYTTLVGLHQPAADVVIELLTAHASQVEVLCLHLPDANGNMRGFRYGPIYEKVLDRFIKFGGSGVLSRFEMMTMDRSGRVHPDILNIAKLSDWQGLSRAGTLAAGDIGQQQVEETPRHTTPVGCSFTPFYDQNVLLPNGDVLLCCMSYDGKHKLGNLLEGDYWSLFTSPGMSSLRHENQNFGWSERSACRSCSRATRYDVPADKRQTWAIVKDEAPAEALAVVGS